MTLHSDELGRLLGDRESTGSRCKSLLANRSKSVVKDSNDPFGAVLDPGTRKLRAV
jgi:hypothetical protein